MEFHIKVGNSFNSYSFVFVAEFLIITVKIYVVRKLCRSLTTSSPTCPLLAMCVYIISICSSSNSELLKKHLRIIIEQYFRGYHIVVCCVTVSFTYFIIIYFSMLRFLTETNDDTSNNIRKFTITNNRGFEHLEQNI